MSEKTFVELPIQDQATPPTVLSHEEASAKHRSDQETANRAIADCIAFLDAKNKALADGGEHCGGARSTLAFARSRLQDFLNR